MRSSVVGFVRQVIRSQKVINDQMSYFAAQSLSGGEVKAEMDPSENSAQRSLFKHARGSAVPTASFLLVCVFFFPLS
jgi:hypothetical protein